MDFEWPEFLLMFPRKVLPLLYGPHAATLAIESPYYIGGVIHVIEQKFASSPIQL